LLFLGEVHQNSKLPSTSALTSSGEFGIGFEVPVLGEFNEAF
jgi:hypothetical protein